MTFETVRYNYRLRPSKTARRHLCEEGDRARWVWNQCVRRSSEMYEHEGVTIGAGDLDGELTDWRNSDDNWSRWLAGGSSVVQQQAIRDFCAARSKALKDFATGVARSKRRGLPRFHSRHQSQPSVLFVACWKVFKDREHERERMYEGSRMADVLDATDISADEWEIDAEIDVEMDEFEREFWGEKS